MAVILFLIASFILALLKAIPVSVAGQIAGAKSVGYFRAVGLFLIIYVSISIYMAISGSLYLNNVVFVIADICITLFVMALLLKSYNIYNFKNKLLFFVLGIILDIILLIGLFYLLFNGSFALLSPPMQG